MATKKVEEVVEAVEAKTQEVMEKAAPKAERAEKVVAGVAEKVEEGVGETAAKAKKTVAKAKKTAEKVEEAVEETAAKAKKTAAKKVEKVAEKVEKAAKETGAKVEKAAAKVEKVAKETDAKVEKVAEKAEKAVKAADAKVEKVAEKVEEAAKETGAKVEKAADDTAKKAGKAADKGDKTDKVGKKAKGAAKEAKKLTGTPRLKQKYQDEVVSALTAQFHYKNPMETPRLEKVIINMGLGAEKENPKGIEAAAKELGIIAGQKPVVTKAKKSVANFKVREGMNVGAMVTLRGDRMYYFVDKFVNIVLPRVRDFRGVPNKSFDGRGNYAMGVREQLIFPEINYDDVDRVRGMNIVFVTSAKTDEEAKALLTMLGMPFVQD